MGEVGVVQFSVPFQKLGAFQAKAKPAGVEKRQKRRKQQNCAPRL
ncbi:hypothetical protein CCACVL1_30361 [Corchorus capsularis]|uniref:Uncharacterized protein n=1 Tax=Corchorus capsularis TaxID=210143 RepID=A0A1R3FXK6_COCAP|nr:hypothetical protein CCACVL1_30361 [Corchorus capsularis]